MNGTTPLPKTNDAFFASWQKRYFKKWERGLWFFAFTFFCSQEFHQNWVKNDRERAQLNYALQELKNNVLVWLEKDQTLDLNFGIKRHSLTITSEAAEN